MKVTIFHAYSVLDAGQDVAATRLLLLGYDGTWWVVAYAITRKWYPVVRASSYNIARRAFRVEVSKMRRNSCVVTSLKRRGQRLDNLPIWR